MSGVYGVVNARDAISRARQTSGSLGLNILKYPDDIDNVPHKFLLNIRRRGANINLTDNGAQVNNRSALLGALVLPVPLNLEDVHTVRYSAQDLGFLGTTLDGIANALGNVVEGEDPTSTASIMRRAQAAMQSAASQLGGGNGAAVAAIVAAQAAAAVARRATRGFLNVNPMAALSNQFGKIINPHTVASFQGVNLRTFNYTWRLSPSTRNESRNLQKIYNALRFNMLPTTGTNLIMDYPSEVIFQILGASQEYTMPTKPCVIESVSFNKAASGSPIFFAETGAPVFHELTLKLMEVRPIFQDDLRDSGYGMNDTDYQVTTTQPSRTPNPTSPSGDATPASTPAPGALPGLY
jgi:hypothetical protein